MREIHREHFASAMCRKQLIRKSIHILSWLQMIVSGIKGVLKIDFDVKSKG